ncbi:serine/threonine-protein kinase HipA [Psychrobacter sp. PL15]|uniref:type II toxin-antitoxin system HipA family toxin n=1 Tax=Psychrobacter sp. PL15 TaxID=3071719 RepID=UPI002E0B4603|nr:serine/threonine-protein kinase HipA [Psychrobacter sp. PL15]
MYTPIPSIKVFYQGFGEHRLVGYLTIEGHRPVFGYDDSWVSDGFELSPIEMPLRSTPYRGLNKNAYYLCGLLADSLPDGWGILLMDRFFRQISDESSRNMTVLERFAYVGESVMGALTFVPEQPLIPDAVEVSLAKLAHANQKLLAGQESDILVELIAVGGSPQGARPKALVLFDKDSKFITTDLNTLHPSATPWLIKFPAQNEHKSVCLLEAIYADMAKLSGLNMPCHYYFDIDENHSAFGVERFDRIGGQRVHIHTLAGLLDLDFRLPFSSNYLQYLRCVRMLTQSQQQVELAYRQAVFNVVFNNKDDHSKNFSFMMNKQGEWSLSPAYDLSYNTGFDGCHQMDIGGEVTHPTLTHLIKLATQADIKQETAKEIIEQVTAAAKHFLTEIESYCVDKNLLNQVIHDVTANVNRMK